MRLFTTTVLALVALAASVSCSNAVKLPALEMHGMTMGTSFSITVVDPPAALSLESLRLDVQAELERVEAIASTYRPDSELSILNRATSTDWIPVSTNLCVILFDALEISQLTHGAFDLTVAPLVDLWGFGVAARTEKLPTQFEIDAALQTVGFSGLVLDCNRPAAQKMTAGMRIDLSGWAKGYAVDRLSVLVETAGVENYLVEIGGEIRVKGHNADAQLFLIGIEEPIVGAPSVNTTFRVSNSAIATSGDYRNFFVHDGVRYSHTIEPKTGWPISHNLASVTVIGETAARADAMATALLVLGPEAGMAFANENEIAAFFICVGTDDVQTTRSNALVDLSL